jgi:hypothetical protein
METKDFFSKQHLPESKRRRCFRAKAHKVSVPILEDSFRAQKLISQSLYPGYVANVHAVSPSALHPPTGVVPSLPPKGSTCSLFAFWIILGIRSL